MNQLFYGDNLDVLRRYVKDDSIDLIYLDPPFNSNQDFNALFTEQDGSRAAAQIKAFGDTWRWDTSAAAAYQEIVEGGGQTSLVMQAFRQFLGENDMLAYLSMMAPRLLELRRVLKSNGSIFLHCDTTASAYLRLLLDQIFGIDCFKNEIIWSYRRWPTPSKMFQRMHDTVFFYTKGKGVPKTFNVEYEPNSPSYQKRFKGKTQMLDPETRTRKITLETDSKGLPRRDVWEISIIAGVSKERLGYPTQKPIALLERIINAATNRGDVVLDPFCGCGTAIDAAEGLGRQWIGIDITPLAINLIKYRLHNRFGAEARYAVVGEPTAVPDAKQLAEENPYHFQYWALGLVGARPAEEKKGADKGIDGRLYFHDETDAAKTKQIVFSVKAGHTDVSHVRDLRGVIEREAAAIGVLIVMEEVTKPMRTEAASADFYVSPFGKYPRIQILTIADLLSGKGIDYPSAAQRIDKTFKKATTATDKDSDRSLPLG